MKKFSDFGIDPLKDKNIFTVPVISIDEIVDKKIVVLDYADKVTTSFGDDRYVLKIESEGKEFKFFTAATPIKDALNAITTANLPFEATIKPQRVGKWKTYFFD